jgi:hypothetical protein
MVSQRSRVAGSAGPGVGVWGLNPTGNWSFPGLDADAEDRKVMRSIAMGVWFNRKASALWSEGYAVLTRRVRKGVTQAKRKLKKFQPLRRRKLWMRRGRKVAKTVVELACIKRRCLLICGQGRQ